MTVSSTTPVVTYPKSASDVGGATDEMHILYVREWGSVISMVCCAVITELCDVDVRAWAPAQPGGPAALSRTTVSPTAVP